MAVGLRARNERRSPRVDVLLRVKGELVPAASSITIVSLNRTGFSALSAVRFRIGERLILRLTGIGGPSVIVSAAAVHTEPRQSSPGLYLTGFRFLPDRQDGVAEAGILQLLSAVAPAGFKI